MPSAGRVAEYAEFFRLVSDCLVATGPEVAAAAAAGAAARAAAQNGQAGTASKAPEPAQGAAGLASKRPRPPPDAGGAGEAELEAKRARPGEKEDAKAKRSSRAAQLAARLAQLEQKAAALQEMSKKRAEEREKQLADAQEEEAEREEPEDAQQGPEEDEDDGMGINAQQRAIADPSFPFRKVCYLMRGPPGCGKSTTARKLLQYHLKLQGVKWTPGPDAPYSPLCRAFVLSTDDFFTFVDDQGEAEYRFDPKKLKEFHPKNQARFENCCELGRTPLFVDNTNIALWEMKDYLLSAEKYGYEVEVVDPREFGEDALNPDVLDQRCQAGAGADRAAGKTIPYAVLDRMCRNLEELPEPANCPTGPEALEAIRNSSNPFGDKGGGKGGGKGGFGGGKGGGFQPPMMQKGGFHQPPPWAGSVGSEIRPKQQAYVPPQVVARPPRPPPEPAAPAAPVTLPKQRMKCTPPRPPAALQQPPEPEASPEPEAPPEAAPEAEAAKPAEGSEEKPRGPRYAGLDVEAKALAQLGTIDLGQWFWSEEHNSALDSVGAPRDVNLFDARCHEPGDGEEGWRLPARLHVTVKFLGGDGDPSDRKEVDELVGTWHSVEVRALVFLRGGGLLCAEVALSDGEGSEQLRALAGDGWRPHITLLSSYPYQAKDSTAVLEAYAAAAAAAAGPAGAADADAPASPPQEPAALPRKGLGGFRRLLELFSPRGARGAPAVPRQEGLSAADRELAESMRSAMQSGAPASSALKEPRMFTDTVLPGGLGTVDLCVIPLSPPRDLGPCKFKLFYK